MRTILLLPLDVPVALGREDAQRLAAAELAKAKYGGVPDWVVHLLAFVRRLLLALSGLLLRNTATSGGLNPVVIVVAVLLLLAVAVIVWRVGLPRWQRHRTEVEVRTDPTRTPASYRAQADAAAAGGDFRTAIGERFRAVVRELEDRTILDPRPARTATEVAVTAGVILSGHRPGLNRAATLFNDTWYGDQSAGPEVYRELCALDVELTAAADRADLGASEPPAGRSLAGAAGAAGAAGGRR